MWPPPAAGFRAVWRIKFTEGTYPGSGPSVNRKETSYPQISHESWFNLYRHFHRVIIAATVLRSLELLREYVPCGLVCRSHSLWWPSKIVHCLWIMFGDDDSSLWRSCRRNKYSNVCADKASSYHNRWTMKIECCLTQVYGETTMPPYHRIIRLCKLVRIAF